jgi:indole-3-glycerol phosphate synthase
MAYAVEAGANVIGVNRRNLETLEMEPNVISRLIPMIPTTVLAIAESGISTRADVEEVAKLGADAVLVGTALSLSSTPEQTVASLAGVPRVRRA